VKITKHVPGCVDMGDPLKESHFQDVPKLFAIPWVKSFSKYPDFYRYSMSEECLMAEYKGGKEWWVVGSIDHPERIQLPKWEPKGKKA